MSPPKNTNRRRKVIEEEEKKNELQDTFVEKYHSEMSFGLPNNNSSMLDTERKNEEGLSKIKKKLSLKVLIPDENRRGSVSDSLMTKKESSAHIEPVTETDKITDNNISNYLQNHNPLSIFSQNSIQKDFLNKKHENAENNNNFNHYSPNFSAGSLKAFSPYYNSINQTPNVNINGINSNYFMFNNNFAGTPLKGSNNILSNNIHNVNFNVNANNPSFNNNSNTLCNNIIISEEILKNSKKMSDDNNSNNNYQGSNNNINLNINNVNTNPTIINIPSKIPYSDDPSKIVIPTPGRNLGFYSWVIHGSPVLHNNPLSNNSNNFPISNSQTPKLQKKKKKLSKKN